MNDNDWGRVLPPLFVGIVGTRHEVNADRVKALMAGFIEQVRQPGQPIHIVSGGQTGVDTIAREFAQENGYGFTEFHERAEVGTFAFRCRARNQKIADASDAMLGLPCEHSTGTYMTLGMFAKRLGWDKIVKRVVTCGKWTAGPMENVKP